MTPLLFHTLRLSPEGGRQPSSDPLPPYVDPQSLRGGGLTLVLVECSHEGHKTVRHRRRVQQRWGISQC